MGSPPHTLVRVNTDSKPGDFGHRLTTEAEQRTWDAQEAFLLGYAQGGTVTAGLLTSGVHRRTAEVWKQKDAFSFKTRLETARLEYCDVIEDKIHELAMGLKPGQNAIVLLARANAEMPEKYRPNVHPTDDTAKELIGDIRKLFKIRNAPETIRLELPEEEQRS
jgi:hypothetical protein